MFIFWGIQMKATREAASPQRTRSPPLEERLETVSTLMTTPSKPTGGVHNGVHESNARPPPRGEGAHSPQQPSAT
ncbi:hypothetical protein NQ315_001506 [Exocentrus adspersus]|uniref:Uncharacterized protein n=1 Tax=Exocentrus adspersus TaxID=1586481 RepID=A0AAV8W8G0_9CUCU|nr:hypothetical protein NQ315_001506 [Exocentrus adspersus]